MQSCEILCIGADRLDLVWNEVEPMISKGMEHAHGELGVSQLRMMIVQQQAYLLVAERDGALVGAGVVEFIQYPNFKAANFIVTGGRGMLFDRHGYEQIRAWMKSKGASKIQGHVRESVARLWGRFGLKEVYRVVRADL